MSKPSRTLVAVGLLLAIVGACAVAEVQTPSRQAESVRSTATSTPSVVARVQNPSCRTALLIIDVQGAWLGSDALTIDGVIVQEKTAGIAESARAGGIPVVFVKDVAYRDRFTDQQLEIAPPLEVLDGDLVVEKLRPNGFQLTSLEETLRDLEITTLLITGYASHECVGATVAGAIAAGFEVIIVADGHSGGGMGILAQRQNRIWEEDGLQVIQSSEIDFTALCASPDSGDGS